jgi:polysaccharide export outer membrane protein
MKLGRCVRSLGLAAALSCSHVGPFVWVNDYAAPADAEAGREYQIAPGDLLSVRVYLQEGMTTRERVRHDGRISLPMIGDVQAAGRSPSVLAEQIQSRLKAYINKPVVTVTVEETRPLAVPVLGEVARPGQYNLEKGAGVLDALAAAGGFTDFAHRDRIFVLRRQPALVRIRFTFEELSRGQGRAIAFRLQPGDAVVVE